MRFLRGEGIKIQDKIDNFFSGSIEKSLIRKKKIDRRDVFPPTFYLISACRYFSKWYSHNNRELMCRT